MMNTKYITIQFQYYFSNGFSPIVEKELTYHNKTQLLEFDSWVSDDVTTLNKTKQF